MKSSLTPAIAALSLSLAFMPARAGVLIDFENLPSSPPANGVASLYDANGGSYVIAGIIADSRLRVLGKDNSTCCDPGNPLSSIPHSGLYYISNESYPDPGDSIALDTPMVLTGAWFSQIEYYGYGHDSMTITIEAMNGATVLGSASVVLPANPGPGPLPMEFLDSSSFQSLSGITGYRVRQSPLDAGSRHWSADDFQFAAVPEPALVSTVIGGALALVAVVTARKRTRAVR